MCHAQLAGQDRQFEFHYKEQWDAGWLHREVARSNCHFSEQKDSTGSWQTTPEAAAMVQAGRGSRDNEAVESK